MHPCLHRRTRPTAALLLLATLARAGDSTLPPGPPSLLQSWQASIRHDPAFAALEARHEAGASRAAQARALWLPQLSAGGGIGRGDQRSETHGAAFSTPTLPQAGGVNFLTSINAGTRSHWSVQAQQPLLDVSRRADAQGLRSAAQQSDWQYRAARQQQLLKVAQSWFAVLNAANDLLAVERTLAAAQRAGGLAQARYDTGDLPITDLREAQAVSDATAVRLLDARNALELARLAFTNLTGLQPPVAVPLPDGAPAGLSQHDPLESWLQRAQQGNPALQQQVLRGLQAERDVERHGALAGARLSLVAAAGVSRATGSGSYGSASQQARDTLLGLEATIPLFTGGLRSAQHDEARALARAAAADVEAARLQVAEQVNAAWLQVTTAEARRRALVRAAASATARLAATRTGAETGERTTLEVLGAESEQLRIDAERQRAVFDLLLADLNLRAVAGTLDDDQLGRVDAWLRPEGPDR